MPVRRIDPGRLRRLLTLEAMTPVPDGAGGFTQSWTALATVHAALEPVAAAPRFGADQSLPIVTHVVTLRARADMRSGMRFAAGDRRFSIETVHDPDETGRFLICRVREEGR
ncbi:phage head closure protein [Aquibium microcysteis]|uniref:phage head closure protein n=1 Tax=Aquibium microcysteis TaxID=675281 RepID=UPI00165D24B1|nr:phage head closure protein [Aquibium microcysteis]